jgi:hypothetical protein
MGSAAIKTDTAFGKTTIVTAQLENGFVIVESSSCVDPANYDADIGYGICIKRIEDKVWELEGYRLQCKLNAEPTSFMDRVRIEKNELDAKIGKLSAFLGTATFYGLNSIDKSALFKQLDAMNEYSSALLFRISRFCQ